MPSRRRRRSKNLGTNLAEVQRRLRYLERRPVRTKLQRNVVTTASIAVNAVGPDEVSFGTTVITDAAANTIENPKDGLFVVNETAGTTSVYSEEKETFIQLPAVDDTARTTADGKSTIYRQNNAPTGGTYSAGDLWYDQDDSNKMYRYVGSPTNAWTEAVVLGTNAVANLNASVITAGTINGNTINIINLNASEIDTGIITGITFRTSETQRRIEITNEDDMIFYNNSNVRMGTVTSVNAGANTLPGDDDNIFVDDGVLIYGGSSAVDQGTVIFPSIVASNNEVGLYGGSNYFLATTGGTEIRGPSHYNYADEINIASGYGGSNENPWYIQITGPLFLDYSESGQSFLGEPLREGSGQPPEDGKGNGHTVFMYT